MTTLIVYAHPNTEGHCSNILKQVLTQLKKRKKKYEVLDLYKLKYDPILYESEHYTVGNRKVSKQNKEIQEKISNSKKIIFIYPVWWNSMPAILKGFVDKGFVSHFAFKYKNGMPIGILKGKKAAVFITSGANNLFSFLFLGNRAGKIMSKDILGFCGIKAKTFQLGNCIKFNKEKIPKIKKLVNNGLNWLY